MIHARDPFIFPPNPQPRIDPHHIAFANRTGSSLLRFSAVAQMNKSFLRLDNSGSVASTTTSGVYSAETFNGPTVFTPGGSDYIMYTDVAGAIPSGGICFAAMCGETTTQSVVVGMGGATGSCGLSEWGGGAWYLYINGGLAGGLGIGNMSSGGVEKFAIGSLTTDSSPYTYFVGVHDMRNARTAWVTGTTTGDFRPMTSVIIGNRVNLDQNWNEGISNVAIIDCFVGLQQFLLWCEDPRSFWFSSDPTPFSLNAPTLQPQARAWIMA